MDPKSEIKARLPIEELVGQYCELHRKGRNFVSLCPFHNDTHPSFLISPDKGIAYCFACQTGGDIFNFYQAIERVDFPQAIRDLAERTGVQLPTEFRQTGPKKDERERMRDCLVAAAKFYAEKLAANNIAREYLASRGVDDALREKFGIGYAPDSFSATYDELLKQGFSKNEIAGSGLAVQRDLGDGSMYDRFRHRLMFPIFDQQGDIIGFGGRALKPDDAKYVNSPEGPLYHKSSVLYGLSHAKEAIRSSKSVLLVEGYFDVISAHKAGVTNVVAVSGTALTVDHAKLITRYADKAIMCLDQDKAGRDAAARAFQTLAPVGISIHALTIPAKDPDELIQRDAAAFKEVVDSGGAPYIDVVLQQLSHDEAFSTPQGKRDAMEHIIPLLSAVPAAVEREAYLDKAAYALNISQAALAADLKRLTTRDKLKIPVEKKTTAFEHTPFSRSELCMGIVLLYPALREMFAELLPPDDETLTKAHDLLVSGELTQKTLPTIDMDEEVRARLTLILLYSEENFASWSQSTAQRELNKMVKSTNRDIIIGRQRKIIQKLKEARDAGRTDEEMQLLNQYQQSLKLAKMAS